MVCDVVCLVVSLVVCVVCGILMICWMKMFGVMMCFGFSVLSGMIFDIWMIVIFVVLVMIGLKLCVVLWYMRLF